MALLFLLVAGPAHAAEARPAAAARAQAEPRVLVLRSADLRPYVSASAGFAAELSGGMTVDTVTLDERNPKYTQAVLSRAAERGGYSLVLALGPYAANSARQHLGDVPLVFALVPFHERYALDGPNVTGISLTRSLAADVLTLTALAPAVKRVGVLHDPRSSGPAAQEARAALEAQALTVVPLPLSEATRVGEVLQGAKGKVDGVVMVPDSTVASAGVVRALLHFGKEQRLPVLGLSPTQVKEGAFVALSLDHVALGRQAARLARRVVVERVNPGALAVADPEGLELCLNVGTARRLEHSRVALDAVLAYAARQNLTLRIFE